VPRSHGRMVNPILRAGASTHPAHRPIPMSPQGASTSGRYCRICTPDTAADSLCSLSITRRRVHSARSGQLDAGVAAPSLVRELLGRPQIIEWDEIDIAMMRPLEVFRARSEDSIAAGSAYTQDEASPDPRAGFPASAGPLVHLRFTGDGGALARTLARVLVRRALLQEGALPAPDDCASPGEAA
jgi:hypothetical protein